MAGSTYQFLAGLGKKVPQQVLHDEYYRIRRNLMRSINAYKKEGIDVSFFDMPEAPKKVTEASIRQIGKKAAEWKYLMSGGPASFSYTKGGMVHTQRLNIAKTAPDVVSAKSQKIKKNQLKNLKKKEREALKKKNAGNKYYQQALAEGYSLGDIPSDTDNFALKLLMIAEDALNPEDSTRKRYHAQTKRKYNRQKSYSFNENQRALFSVVQKKAEMAIQRMIDKGFNDPEYAEDFSRQLERDFYSIASDFEAWLWASDQYNNPDMSGLDKVLHSVTKHEKKLTGSKKRRLADGDGEEFYEG